MSNTPRFDDPQAPPPGKVANDHNKTGDRAPTGTHQGQRTPQSRSDRTALVGSGNQSQTRQGAGGAR